MDEHNEKTDGQQAAGQPDRPRAPMEGGYAADTRAQREQQHHAEIRQRLVEYFLIPRMEVGAQRLRTAAHIADAHGAGVGVAPHLAEGLHLHGAHEGHHGIGGGVQRFRQEAHRRQQHDLRQNDELPPVYLLHPLEVPVDALRDVDTQQERQHGD